MFAYRGSTAMITGASKGLGAAFAKVLACRCEPCAGCPLDRRLSWTVQRARCDVASAAAAASASGDHPITPSAISETLSQCAGRKSVTHEITLSG